ncbi:hypothetical protein ACVW16_001244 [Bradyrhizobium sp. USDA 4474]
MASLTAVDTACATGRFYAASNFFQPSFKLKKERREGSLQAL